MRCTKHFVVPSARTFPCCALRSHGTSTDHEFSHACASPPQRSCRKKAFYTQKQKLAANKKMSLHTHCIYCICRVVPTPFDDMYLPLRPSPTNCINHMIHFPYLSWMTQKQSWRPRRFSTIVVHFQTCAYMTSKVRV
jgi:hypothetical protein